MSNAEDRPGPLNQIGRMLVLGVAGFLALQLISLYLSWPKQIILGSIVIVIGIAANRLSPSRVVTLALMFISMTATLRYAWWRTHLLVDFFSDQSNNRFGLDSAFMLILISAEAYTILIMVLGYMQMAWPLRRVPIPMPADESLWPHVDVLIPTYNEPLSLVRYTTLAANQIDYPPEKLHVYILDDGTREDFREFAKAAGVGYVTRKEHGHAKAGNINHALTTMSSDYVTIFDCDHVPTRSFLQMTIGWMLADSNLAMLQTPHHFYSPDPFERNLLQYKTIPNEAELFYGIVQDGNDFWNATFFCGSCALIRRSALDSVGGIATETVTEDAHTSLRMQKQGYNTAYINIPQAAGLATETLAAHVGQRVRWARGMIQIFRTDNPLLARGMKLTQRLCYLNAMIHFFYAVPRLVFLGAPLVYMLLGRTIIPGYWVAILAYSIPHLILSSLTNSRIQGRHRHSFWNEIYESVLAPYILAPTLLALINPKLGKFNVTDKGGTLSNTHFDRKIATPTRWMLGLNFLGVLVAPYRMFVMDPQHPGTVIMNLVWILFNMVILGVAAAVAHEQKQRRSSVRIEARIPMSLRAEGGGLAAVSAMSIDMSIGGASVKLDGAGSFSVGDKLKVAFPEHSGDEEIGARVVGAKPGEVRLAFLVPTIAEQETLTRALYSRADAWITSAASKEVDRPLKSLGRVIRLSFYGIYQICKSIFPEKAAPSKQISSKSGPSKKTPSKSGAAAETVASLLLILALGCSQMQALALPLQISHAATVDASHVDSPGSGRSVALKPGPYIPGNAIASAQDEHAGTAAQVLGFKDMGLSQAIEMRGSHSYSTVNFTLSHGVVPRHATLRLFYSLDPSLDPRATSLKLSLNGTQIAVLPRLPGTISSDVEGAFTQDAVDVPEDLLLRSNSLTFEFNGGGILQREDELHARVLCRIGLDSTLEVTGDRLPWRNDLSQLPLPLFDSELQTPTTLPMIFLSQPSTRTLEAAGIVASWLGLQAGSKPVRFAASVGQIPMGNAMVFSASRSMLPASLQIPAGAGPLLALRTNPSDPFGSILVVAGDDDEQILTAARTLSLTRRATPTTQAVGFPLAGDTAQIPELIMPPLRMRGDAPRWMPTHRVAPLTDCNAHQNLVSDGSTPLPIYFHLPPDLFYGEKQNLTLHLNYKYNALQAAAGSALRVIVNGNLVSEVFLPPGTDFVERQRLVLVPVADLRPFGNTILFNFDFIPANLPAPSGSAQAALQGQISCSSSLDLTGLTSWASMPNLELFADAGFPFTQLADLSQTTVILPNLPSSDEISLYLNLMSHFGAQTGYPALRVTVEDPYGAIDKAHDYLILGSNANQPAFQSIETSLPVSFDSAGIHVRQSQSAISSLSSLEVAAARWWSGMMGSPFKERLPSEAEGATVAMIEQIESPGTLDRSIVLVALKDDAASNAFTRVLFDRSHSGDIAGSVSVLRNAGFESYAISADTYHVGDISWYARMRIWLTEYSILLLLAVTALSFVVALWTREWLSRHAAERLELAETANAN